MSQSKKPKHLIEGLTFQGTQQVFTFKSNNEILDKIFSYHKTLHCVEIYTTFPDPLPPPELDETPFEHVLLNSKIFDNEDAVEELLKPSTIFISLTPITTGNSLFIQNSAITFVLNNATYQRFGLVGKQYRNVHYVRIDETNKNLLRRIRPCENIEGLLLCADKTHVGEYIEKAMPLFQQMDGWAPSKELTFDISLLEKAETYPRQWREQFIAAADKCLLARNQISTSTKLMRYTITGAIKFSLLREWIEYLSKDSFVMMMIWDFRDSLMSFTGNKLSGDGFGGGSETVVFGDKVAVPFKIQTVEFIDEE